MQTRSAVSGSSLGDEETRPILSGQLVASERATMTPRAYVAAFAALTLAGFALIVALGLVVDGYGIFGTRLIPASRFPSNMRLMKHWDRVTKAIEIAERRGDEILFIGDSRTQHGIDPDAPALGGVKAYNAALVGATLAEQFVALDWSLAHDTGVKRVVWGLSFETFPFGIFPLSDYGDSAFAGRSVLHGFLHHLFAYDYVIASWKALLQARHQVRAPMKRNGVVTYGGSLPEGPGIAKLFDDELHGTDHNISGPMSQEAIDAAHAQLTERLIKLKAAGIDVDLVVLPLHVWRLEFFRQIGVEAQDEAWKRRLAGTVEELSKAPGTGKIHYFDFQRPNHLVEQSVFVPPPAGERRYFLESSHFFPWLGDKLLARVFGKAQESEKELEKEQEKDADPFGRQIGNGGDSISIDEDIASAKAELDQWEAAHPDEVSHVKALLSK